jgi:hypothetical protein
LITTESGLTATFSVALTEPPSGDVTIGVSSSDTTEGTVSTAQLTFTTTNWMDAQVVTVTGVDDLVDDGDTAYTVVLATAVGGGYDGIEPTDVTTINTDNDTAGITVTPTTGLVTTETRTTATFSVALNSEPTANVSIGVASSDTSEGTVSTAQLTFTTTNWSLAQTVTVTGVDDFVDDGDIGYTVILATAAGGGYGTVDPDDVSVTNTDNDTAGFTVAPTSGLVTTEAGGVALFTVALTSKPTGDVTVAVTSSDTSEGSVSPALLTSPLPLGAPPRLSP